MSSLTCMACRVVFSSPDHQRDHYHSDLHRFNLKRKVAGLDPATQEQYDEKMRNEKADSLKKSSNSDTKMQCGPCRKSFSSLSTYEQHVRSKKHIEQVQREKRRAKKEAPENATRSKPVAPFGLSEEDLPEEQAIEFRLQHAPRLSIKECLFCQHKSSTLAKSIQHMGRNHGLFIPDVEYLQDPEGLVQYLGEKVGVAWACLFCSKSFRSLEAVRAHMESVSHCKLNYDDAADEFEEFYDYTIETEEDEEGDDVMEEEATDRQLTVPSDEGKLNAGEIADDGSSLVLPSQRLAVHRSLVMYHKQYYRKPHDRDIATIDGILREYKQLGWYTREEKNMRRKVLKQQGRIVEGHKADKMAIGMKNNKIQSKHFRPQVVF